VADNFEGRLACVIAADGSIVRGYRIAKCVRVGVEPGICTVGLLPDHHEMRMRTYAPDGKPADRSFHRAVFRD